MGRRAVVIIIALSGALAGLFSSTAQAATLEAASCSQKDVQAAIDKAVDGDVVLVPAGKATWTTPDGKAWAPSIKINKGIVLKGAGIDKTTIIDGTIHKFGHEHLISVRIEDGKPFRITGFAFTEVNDHAIVVYRPCKTLRIDHCKFAHIGGGVAVRVYSAYGVIDHCDIVNAEIGHMDDRRIAWKKPLTLGTEKALYVEDCTYNNTTGVSDDVIDGRDGGRYVFRHNKVTNSMMHCHGPGGAQPRRGTHSYEFYENKFTFVEPLSAGHRIGAFRGGTGVIFNNTGMGNWSHIHLYWDGVANPKEIVQGKYPGLDAIGRTTDHDGDGVQDLVPLFAWNNKRINYSRADLGDTIDLRPGGEGQAFYIQKGRDFYVDTVTQDPKTGTYSATYTDDDGKLKTWTYKPYTYPHPLTKTE